MLWQFSRGGGGSGPRVFSCFDLQIVLQPLFVHYTLTLVVLLITTLYNITRLALQ